MVNHNLLSLSLSPWQGIWGMALWLGHFLIKRPNQVTYLLETQVLGLFTLGKSINIAIFTLTYTQARIFECFSALERQIWNNSTLRSASPAQDDANSWKFYSQTTCRTFTELCTPNCLWQGWRCCLGRPAMAGALFLLAQGWVLLVCEEQHLHFSMRLDFSGEHRIS